MFHYHYHSNRTWCCLHALEVVGCKVSPLYYYSWNNFHSSRHVFTSVCTTSSDSALALGLWGFFCVCESEPLQLHTFTSAAVAEGGARWTDHIFSLHHGFWTGNRPATSLLPAPGLTTVDLLKGLKQSLPTLSVITHPDVRLYHQPDFTDILHIVSHFVWLFLVSSDWVHSSFDTLIQC